MPTLPLTQLDERRPAADLDNRTFSLTFAQPVPVRDLLLLVRGTNLSLIPDPAITGAFIGELKNVTVRQALDSILPPLGLDYGVDGVFVRVFARERETRIFDINYIPAERSATSTLGGRAVDPGALSSASVSTVTSSDIFADLAKGVQTLLSDRATFNLDRKAGLLQVTDFPERLDRVADYLEAVEGRVQRQVEFDTRIVEVELKDVAATGVDWRVTGGCPALRNPVNEVTLVPSLLQAIVNIDGEALVMHAGDKPYVVSPSGQVELASRGLTLDAVTGIVAQLLPIEFRNALDELGAVQYALPPRPEFPQEQFIVVVARGGDDVWAEIRRKRVSDEDEIPEEVFETLASPPSAVATAWLPPAKVAVDDDLVELEPPLAAEQAGIDDGLALPAATHLWPGRAERDADLELGDEVEIPLPHGEAAISYAAEVPAARVVPPIEPPIEQAPFAPLVAVAPPPAAPVKPTVPVKLTVPVKPTAPVKAAPPVTPAPPLAPKPEPPAWRASPPPPAPKCEPPVWQAPTPPLAPSSAVVLQMSRNPIRVEAPPSAPADDTLSGLERLLRTAAARGASTLYLSSDARPSVRVDGQLQSLDSEPVHTSSDVISLLLTLMPDRSHEALRTGATTEWICDIEDIGRVRCMSFSDHHGPGGVFRLMPVRTVSVDQLGLAREIQSLAIEPEGLVLVVGSRSSGKRTLMSALVDLINRTRPDHVITIEREVNIVHARGSSFISQREVRGNDEEVLAAARAALREDPDVIVLEQIHTGLLMNLALEAAASGHLVIGGFSAHNATESIDRIIELYAPGYGRQVQLALADNLRGVVAQVLLPKIGGGRVAAREVLLNTPGVAGVIAEGKTSQLPMAIEGGRRHGMVSLNDALVGYVRSGIVDVREAYRHVSDRPSFLAQLKRQGVDTSAFERPG